MAPALTKILKNGHGIHLSSPPASVRMDSDRRTMCFIEPAPRATSTEDGDIQKVLLNISSFQFLESCSPSSLLDVSVNPVFSPCRKASASQCETDSLLSPGSFAELFSFNQDQRDFQALCSAFPGVPGMFLAPSPQHNGQEACVQHGQSAAPACRPDGGDVHYSSLTFSSVCPSYSHGEIKSQGCGALFATPAALTQVKQVTGAGCPPSASLRPCVGWATLDRPACKAGLQDALEEQLSRQAGLQDRAGKLQRRLQGLLGEQAVRHCSQQLEGLKRNPQHGKVFLDGSAPADPDVLPPQAGTKSPFYWERSSKHLDFFAEVGEFSQCSQLMLRDLQTALDSEATASSSSDEEPEEHHGRTSPTISRCEKQWLEERAELGSRWSWLHLHLAELERRIQQLIGVHRRIRSSKGGVVLADSQPLTDQQIQQTLMKEITGLSCTGSDADIEACSPTRLLHNIERQSAHLNQIVNSLMPNFSPLSKQPTSWKGKRTSGQRGDALLPESSKRRRLTNRRLFKADVSCVCARTRPLVSYHKPKLFTLTPLSSSSLLDSINSTSTLSSCLLSSSCSCCSLCDPVVLCSDLDCSTSRIPSSSTSRATETSMCHCSQRVRGMQGQFVLDIKSSRSAKYKRHSSTPLLHGHKYKNHARHHRKIILGLSPIRASGSHRTQPTRFSQKRRKRKHNRVVDDEEDVQYQLYDPEENSDDLLKESYTYASHKRASQGFVRGHRGESVYSINSVLMPMSLTKVEKLQYKDILTPRWRLVETPSLLELETVSEASSEEVQVEDLSDEAFAQRHMALEQKEKLRWPSWGKRKCHTRSGSRLSGSVCGMYTSGEESSVECSAQLDADEQSKSEEQLPQIPWEPRVFPLDEDEEALSLSNGQQKAPSGWTESSEDLSTSSSSDVYPDQWSGAALPPRGQCGSSTPNGSIPCRIAHV